MSRKNWKTDWEYDQQIAATNQKAMADFRGNPKVQQIAKETAQKFGISVDEVLSAMWEHPITYGKELKSAILLSRLL